MLVHIDCGVQWTVAAPVSISLQGGTFILFVGSEADIMCLERLTTTTMGVAVPEFHNLVCDVEPVSFMSVPLGACL